MSSDQLAPLEQLDASGRTAAWLTIGQTLGRIPLDRREQILGLLARLPSASIQSDLATGLAKNLVDNPMFVEWLGRIAARLSSVALAKFFDNLIVGEIIEGSRRRLAHGAAHGTVPPLTLVINPTMNCNLRCSGCYSYNFEKTRHMAYGLLARVLGECRQLGCKLITVSGGEPLLYPHFFRMVEEFSDLAFLTFSNATLIDEGVAQRISQAGNVFPAISVEGFERETDARRGRGVHARALAAMRRLRQAGVFFGFSATPTRENSDLWASDELIDYYLEQGVLFGWFFTYLPLGLDPDLSRMATPEQRDRLRRKTREWQRTRPLFIGDFWNDGGCVGGCLSASRYAYVTPDGWVTPCTFVHFATHNLGQYTLAEIFESPFFRAIRARQPYHRNLLRPCKIIDHPQVLRRLVRQHGARPTCAGAEALLTRPDVVAFLDRYAEEFGRLADAAWRSEEYQEGRSVLVPFLGRIDCEQRFAARMRNAERVTEAVPQGGRPEEARLEREVRATMSEPQP